MKLLRETKNQSHSDLEYLNGVDQLWENCEGTAVEKLESFTNYVSRQSLTKFLARSEVFQKQLNVNGSIVEVGVHRGASYMTWAHLSSIFEPVNYLRKVIGFDRRDGQGRAAVEVKLGISRIISARFARGSEGLEG